MLVNAVRHPNILEKSDGKQVIYFAWPKIVIILDQSKNLYYMIGMRTHSCVAMETRFPILKP